MNAVLDTNVLVSGLLTRGGVCARIILFFADGAVTPCVDARILAECQRVLPRPELRIRPDRVSRLLAAMRWDAELVTPRSLAVRLPHPDDLPFLEVAAHVRCPLVTCNIRHFPAHARAGVTVLSPRQSLDLIQRTL
ncbi:MAG: PIN domain-containing protein [Planctomycetes bacterium]|nr:PIN domain-containing protein [Planctomycetota bacterium]